MAGHARGHSMAVGEGAKGPHTVSLKVLRLSRPSLSTQQPLPRASHDKDDGLYISPLAGLSVPPDVKEKDSSVGLPAFSLTPALTLPSAFASAYVGENFACTLSANNELEAGADKSVSNVRISAEMQTPSNPPGAPLPLEGGPEDADGEDEEEQAGSDGVDLAHGESMQRIIRLDLKEEGNHILAVTVTYTESQLSGKDTAGEGSTHTVTGARVRTFRKLYQFVAQQLLSVRTKTGALPHVPKGSPAKYVLEAQLENMGEGIVCLEKVEISPHAPFTSTSLNWDMKELEEKAGFVQAPLLNPRDVMQVAFLLQQDGPEQKANDADSPHLTDEQRTVLGQLSIQWRGHMGDRGSLSTGWLSAKVH